MLVELRSNKKSSLEKGRGAKRKMDFIKFPLRFAHPSFSKREMIRFAYQRVFPPLKLYIEHVKGDAF
tara:strand:- start:31648 stop:31848 length:201 start_codon:yes stop_codon:yes gene_type:complete